MTKIVLLTTLLFLVSCIKTADQVQREKRMQNISEQMKDSQSLVSEIHSQLKDMQRQLDLMNGRLEVIEHQNKSVDPTQASKTSESMALMKSQQETLNSQMVQMQNELKAQREFIQKVTTSLASEEKPKASKKKSAKDDLNAALEDIRQDKYSEARSSLEALIDHSDLTPGDHNKVLHGLGKTEFYTKNYDKSLTYFSKIYTKFPKSSLAPDSLLFIGRTLDKMGKKSEAKEAFAKVTEDYPGSKAAAAAKKEL
jgi:TolA-binding protein